MSLDIIYYSNRSGNTEKFVKKLGYSNSYRVNDIPLANKEYVLFVPTYGGGDGEYAIPRAVANFLNVKDNRNLLRAVVGFGNTNFGEHYCKAAYMISEKTGVPLLATVELLGTPEDVDKVTERLKWLNEQLQLS